MKFTMKAPLRIIALENAIVHLWENESEKAKNSLGALWK
jgi:hypothetical protein